jgi:hypothetical protein
MSWRERARKAIEQAHAALPEGVSFKDRKRAIDAVYPFGERQYHPYKQWLKERRAYLLKYDPKAPPPPLVRDMLAEKLSERVASGDIIFPFAERSETT